MDPPAASATSSAASATLIKSPDTTILPWQSRNADDHRRESAVDELHKSTDSAKSPATRVAMEDEFRSILVSISPANKTNLMSNSSSAYTDSEFSSYSHSHEGTTIKSEAVPNQPVDHLRGIAQRMIAAGYSKECIKAYASVRKTVVDDKFKELVRIERMSSKNIQRLEWMVQQEKIQLWIHGARACVRSLFAGERTLSEQIFQGLGTDNNNIADDCFMKTVKDSAIQLFDFAEAISTGRRSPEKLFKILDLYGVLYHLLADIDAIFESKSGEFIRKRAAEILSRLSEAARGMLSEFEKAVLGELTEVAIDDDPEGSIHPTTIYVMNYIHDMMEHEQILSRVIVSNPSSLEHIWSSDLDFDFSEFEGEASALVLHWVWIIVVLKFKLQGKSKQYRNASSAHLFITNNVDYIVQEIKGLRIGSNGWMIEKKLISLARANYQKSTRKRTKILDCFKCGSY